jgi:hypothetical protein
MGIRRRGSPGKSPGNPGTSPKQKETKNFAGPEESKAPLVPRFTRNLLWNKMIVVYKQLARYLSLAFPCCRSDINNIVELIALSIFGCFFGFKAANGVHSRQLIEIQ